MSTEDPELLKLYREVWTVVDKSYSQKAHSALVVLQDYVNGAIIQYHRYSKAKENSFFGNERQEQLRKAYSDGNLSEIPKIMSKPDDWLEILQVLLDMHFFLICIDKVQNLVEYIAKADGDSKLKKLEDEVRQKFKPFNDARNYLEHIHERIRDKPDDLGLSSTDGKILNFRNKKGEWQTVEINESSIMLVRNTYDELLTIFRSRPDRVGGWKE